jgi:hypothetical protein
LASVSGTTRIWHGIGAETRRPTIESLNKAINATLADTTEGKAAKLGVDLMPMSARSSAIYRR